MAAHQDIGVQEHGEGFGQLSEQLQEMLAVTLVAKVAMLIFREPSGESVLAESECAMDAPRPRLDHKARP